MLVRLWKKGNPSALLVGMQTGATTMGNSMEFPQKAKNEMAWGPRNPLLGLYPKIPTSPIFISDLASVLIQWKLLK